MPRELVQDYLGGNNSFFADNLIADNQCADSSPILGESQNFIPTEKGSLFKRRGHGATVFDLSSVLSNSPIGAFPFKLGSGSRPYVIDTLTELVLYSDGVDYAVRNADSVAYIGHTTGTASTNATTTVTGTSTAWTTHILAGDLFRIDSIGTWIEITSVDSATSLTLISAYAASSGAENYTIRKRTNRTHRALNVPSFAMMNNEIYLSNGDPVNNPMVYNGTTLDTVAVIPKAKFLLSHKNYIFATNLDTDTSAIRWSALRDGRTWPAANIQRIFPNDGLDITGIVVYNDKLLVFKGPSNDGTGSSNTISGIILRSPDGTFYRLDINNEGIISTTSITSANTTYSSLLLASPNNTIYSLTVDNAGVLSTTSSSGSPNYGGILLTAPNSQNWRLSVNNSGILLTVIVNTANSTSYSGSAIYEVIGDIFDPENPTWVVNRIDIPPGAGVTFGRTAKIWNGLLVFQGNDGFYAYNNAFVSRISDYISDSVDAFKKSVDFYATASSAILWKGRYWSTVANAAGSTTNNEMWLLDKMLDKNEQGVWWKFNGEAIFDFYVYNNQLHGLDASSPRSLVLDAGTSDRAGNIVSRWVSRRWNFIDRQHFSHAFLTYRAQSAGTITLSFSVDGGSAVNRTIDHTKGTGVARSIPFLIGRVGRTFQFSIAHNGSGEAEIYSMEFLRDPMPNYPMSKTGRMPSAVNS